MIRLHNRALLAPLSGITDLPFRRLAHRMGAGMVVAEMASGKLLARADKRTLRRTAGCPEVSPHVIQIMGHDPGEMAEAARLAADLGAEMIDINMGCPARKVISGLAGSALMREPELALRIVEAVVAAVDLAVSLKMRLGWDRDMLNAAAIAQRAEAAGVVMFFVHGRTRNQFYDGRADWDAIGTVVDAVAKPVYANGDITSLADVGECLKRSGAHGVMIGRGALGRPWFLGQAAAHIDGRPVPAPPPIAARRDLMICHYEDMLGHYGTELGVRVARKHLGWYLEDLSSDRSLHEAWRGRLIREGDPRRVVEQIVAMFRFLDDNYRLAS